MVSVTMDNIDDQKTLQYLSFHEVALQGGFRKAAAALGLSKSVVSARVKALEARLGTRLLQRSTRSLQLTPSGATLYEESTKLVRQLKAMDAAMQSSDALAGRLKISAPVDLGVLWLAPALLDFHADHPRLRVTLLATDDVLEFERHGLDLSLRVNAKSHRHLFQQKLGDADFGVYCSATSPLARAALGERLAFLDEHGVVNLRSRAKSVTLARRTIQLKPHRALEINDMLCAKALLSTPRDVAVYLPAFTVAAELASGAVVDLLPGQPLERATFHLVSDRRADDDARLAALTRFLKDRWRTP